MLSKKDLEAIDQIVSHRIQKDVSIIVARQIRISVPSIITRQIKNDVPAIVKSELKPFSKLLSKIQKDIKILINFFDREILNLKTKVDNLESRVNL